MVNFDDLVENDKQTLLDELQPKLEDESDEDDLLNSVKAFQSKHNDITCLVHDNPEEVIVENYTKDVLTKKAMKSKQSFDIAPGTYLWKLTS